MLQERVDGVRVSATTPLLVERALALVSDRRDVLRDEARAMPNLPLFLTRSGPGFWHHEPLRTFDDSTRRVLERVEAIGADLGDSLGGNDLVHFDYTLGNVLVARDDPERIVAVVDWDGVGASPSTSRSSRSTSPGAHPRSASRSSHAPGRWRRPRCSRWRGRTWGSVSSTGRLLRPADGRTLGRGRPPPPLTLTLTRRVPPPAEASITPHDEGSLTPKHRSRG